MDELRDRGIPAIGRPTLTLFCGLPGAGKTTLAKQLADEGRGVRVCTDDWQHDLGVPPAESGFHERLQRLLYPHALDLLERGCDVILEDGLWRAEERAEKFADARERGARLELHVFDVPLDELWTRLERRNQEGDAGAYPMTRPELESVWKLFERPSDAELASVDVWVAH